MAEEEKRPFTTPEDLGESQAADAGKVSAPGGPGGTGKAGYRRIVEEGELDYRRQHPKDEETEAAPPPEDVSDEEFHDAVQGLQEDRRRERERRKKSA